MSPATPLRVLLDAHAYDDLALDPAVRAVVTSAVAARRLTIYATRAQRDEAADAPHAEQLLDLPVEHVLSMPGVMGGLLPDGRELKGASFIDDARIADVETARLYDEIVAGNPARHARDAILVLTARWEGMTVVTRDERAAAWCRRCAVDVLTPSELVATLAPE